MYNVHVSTIFAIFPPYWPFPTILPFLGAFWSYFYYCRLGLRTICLRSKYLRMKSLLDETSIRTKRPSGQNVRQPIKKYPNLSVLRFEVLPFSKGILEGFKLVLSVSQESLIKFYLKFMKINIVQQCANNWMGWYRLSGTGEQFSTVVCSAGHHKMVYFSSSIVHYHF